ncbi:MFS transporter [Pseudonocardia xishanensis]|uniref:MFS transporter n=1 Tax=Pseudonocardia xishanensis TaxID=630995 RepID=A0ABP8RUU7_9PSEU
MVTSATAGTFVEYYDFAIYGSLAPVLATVFFPEFDSVTALLSTFAVFAVAFVARPLGGLIWGPVGDRIGRKRTLSIIIVMISLATVLIGLIPSYSAIGLAAPVVLILLRLVQGLSAGGEIAGASIFVAEHAHANRRGALVSWIQVATTGAFLSGIVVAAALAAFLPAEAMQSWGWRLPFLLAGPLGIVGLYIRLKVAETPEFESIRKAGKDVRHPLRSTLRDTANLKQIGVAAAYYMPVMVSFYLIMTFMPSYLKSQMKFSATASLSIILVAGAVQLVCVPLFGRLSDALGRRVVLRLATGGFILLTYPAFVMLQSGRVVLSVAGLLLLAIPTAAAQANALQAGLERFPAAIRFTASAATFGLLSAIFGGTAPYVSTFLGEATGSALIPGFYLVLTIIPSFIVSFFASETAREPLR